MKHSILIASMVFTAQLCMAQQTIRLVVTQRPEQHKTEALYIAGNFNGWNPASEQYRLKQDASGNWFIDLIFKPGIYEYKITRGSWEKAECTAEGKDLPNRTIAAQGNPQPVSISIAAWRDNFASPAPRASTRSRNVQVIDTTFYIPQLKRKRRIWIYLPETYSATQNRYPVLYMHDGQNLFDNTTSFAGEWGVDEALDTLGPSLPGCIVIGIDNGGLKRMNEYNPYSNRRFGKGEGNAYIDFIAKTLKPFIDKKYRTLRDKDNTFIAGSSMGGLISYFALLRHPQVFGGAGVFSPSFWIVPKERLLQQTKQSARQLKARIYFYAGNAESQEMVPDMMRVYDALGRYSKSKLFMQIRAEGQHNESWWQREFPAFYRWILQGGAER
jgi:predicted alpha/beta superfamily hydrolase